MVVAPARGRGAAPAALVVLTGLLVLLGACSEAALGAPPQAAEEELKAAFLFNFAKYVEWPADIVAERPSIDLCVLGDDLLHDALQQTLRGKVVRDKPIGIRRLASAQGAAGCHVLFVAGAHHDDMPGIVALVQRHHVLLVGEGPEFLAHGGAIAFGVEDNRLRFDVDADAASSAGLKLSSQLLKVARHVSRRDGGS
ncbi:MAG: YfiR family protein [Thermodesulfobacteriota bacterium]